MSKILEDIRKDIESNIKLYNAALKENNFTKMTAAETALKKSEQDYIEQKQNEIFSECKKTGNPVLEAAKIYKFNYVSHKVERIDGRITGFSLVEDKTRQLDLVKLCKYCEISHLWEYKVEKMNSLLCMRAAKELGMSDSEVKQIDGLFYMQEYARKEEMGAVPTSNSQLVKLLQLVLDAILFEEGDKAGMNKWRCNAHDIAYLLMCYTKRGKQELTVTVAKNNVVIGLVMDVLHRIVTNSVYGIDYRMVKGASKVSTPETKPAKEPAKKEAAKKRTPAKKAKAEDEVTIPRPAKAEADSESAAA